MWTAIKNLANQGIKSLHFGRSSVTDEGLIRFKKSWGAEEEDISYYRCYPKGNARHIGKAAGEKKFHNFFGNLPIGLNRAIGALIYPYLD
jgi:hypothetical protein